MSPHRKFHRGWVPEPPSVIYPWGQWTTHHLMELRERLHVVEREIGDHTVELERHRRTGSKSSWKQSAADHLWKIAIGVALMIGSWLVTGKLPPMSEVIQRL